MKRLFKMTSVACCLTLAATACCWADTNEIELLSPQVYDLGEEPAPPKKVPLKKSVPRPEVDKFVAPPPPLPPPPPQPRYDAPPTYHPAPPPVPAGEDSHFIQADDYFIQRNNLGNHAWIWVELAKMMQSPGANTKGEAEFMKVKDGRNYWTSHFWQTRIASQSELRLGLVVIAFNDHHRSGGYDAPEKKNRARGGSWFMAKITDMSDMYKGYVTVSGNYKVTLRNLRVIVR